MKRCRAVHDVARYRILRCALEEGHKGTHKPKTWESISEAQYKAFSKRLKRSA